MKNETYENMISDLLDQLGIHKITDIEAELEKKFGQDRAHTITEEWDRLSQEADASDTPGCQDKLYEYLNRDRNLSLLVTCYTDADIIRNCAKWLFEHKDYFGKNILDAGCGTGILTCLLAKMLPQSHITAIDRSDNCIKIAQQIREQLGISNVKFINAAVDDLYAGKDNPAGSQCRSDNQCRLNNQSRSDNQCRSDNQYRPDNQYRLNNQSRSESPGNPDNPENTDINGRTFDTVLSVRTFHENIAIRYTDYMFLPFSGQVRTYENIYRPYAEKLAGLVKSADPISAETEGQPDSEKMQICDKGRFICIERNHMDTEYYSLLRCLENAGLKVIAGSMTELKCNESDFSEKSVFQAVIAQRLSAASPEGMSDDNMQKIPGAAGHDRSDDSMWKTAGESENNLFDTCQQKISAEAKEDLFDVWSQKAFAHSDNPSAFTRSQADWYVENHTDKILAGHNTYDPSEMQAASTVMYRLKNDDKQFLLYQSTCAGAGIQMLPMEILDDVKNSFEDRKIIDRAMGYTVREIFD